MNTTPLQKAHEELGARMVSFGGWAMPVSYEGIEVEHQAVRQRAGIFDLCHMGRLRLRGPDADALAGRVLTLDVRGLEVDRTRYALICERDGGIRDDVLVSRERSGLFLVVNAGNREVDLLHLREQASGLDVEIADETLPQAMVAIQGPRTSRVMTALGLSGILDLRYYRLFRCPSEFGDLLVSRTGYTGEDGFEIMLPAERVRELWDSAIERGAPEGLAPCGLGARDTLRLEAGMPLHGHEIDTTINPYEAGLGFAIRSSLPFVGSEALARVAREGPRRRLIGLTVEGPRIPRQDCPVLRQGQRVGKICSGTRSPTLGVNIATALVEAFAAEMEGFEVVIRRHVAKAARTPLPFYRRKD